MLGRSVCLNLLLLAEKVMSASVFLKCVLFPVFFIYVIIRSQVSDFRNLSDLYFGLSSTISIYITPHNMTVIIP